MSGLTVSAGEQSGIPCVALGPSSQTEPRRPSCNRKEYLLKLFRFVTAGNFGKPLLGRSCGPITSRSSCVSSATDPPGVLYGAIAPEKPGISRVFDVDCGSPSCGTLGWQLDSKYCV